jgi:hypothetical protein
MNGFKILMTFATMCTLKIQVFNKSPHIGKMTSHVCDDYIILNVSHDGIV